MKGHLLNLTLACVSLFISLILGEIVVRVLGYHGGISFRIEDTVLVQDPILNWRHRPKTEFYYGDVVYTINERGFRDHDYSYERKGETVRIFLASDSVGFGTNVKLQESYPKQLETLANTSGFPYKVEVISHSMPGLSFRQKVHLIEGYAPNYHPDLIIIDHVMNDVEFESRRREEQPQDEKCAIELIRLPVPCSWKTALKQSAFLFLLKEGVESALHRMNVEDRNHYFQMVEDDVYHRLYARDDRREYLNTWFHSLATYQEQAKIPIVVVVFPLIYDYGNYKWEDINQFVIDLCRANGLVYVSLLDSYRNYPWNEMRVQRGDFTHPSVKGNTVAAQAILKTLLDRGLMVPRPHSVGPATSAKS